MWGAPKSIYHEGSGGCCNMLVFCSRQLLGTFLREALLAQRLLHLKLVPAFMSNSDHLMHSNAVDR